MTKVIVATGNSTGLPDQTPLEVIAMADGGLAGYTGIIDPDIPANHFKPNSDGSVNVGASALPSGAATSALQSAEALLVGAVNETAPASDTASSGLNGRLQRIAQRLSSLIGLLPSALSAGGNLKVSLAESTATQAVSGTVSVSALPGTTLAGSTAVATDMDSGAGVVNVPLLGIGLPASGGPVVGGTATAPLRTDPTGATTQPVTAAALPLPAGAATAAKQPAFGTAGTPSADVITVQGNGGTPIPVSGTFSQAASELHLGEIGGALLNPSANFTRPADTLVYASGDLVANSTTAGSVTPLSWTAARIAAGSFIIRRARCKKSTTGVTLASFRLHLYAASPTCTNGDNGVFLTTESTYLGFMELDMSSYAGRAFSDAATVNGVPAIGSEISVKLASGQTIYGLLEARAAYVPGNAEVFTVVLEVLPN